MSWLRLAVLSLFVLAVAACADDPIADPIEAPDAGVEIGSGEPLGFMEACSIETDTCTDDLTAGAR